MQPSAASDGSLSISCIKCKGHISDETQVFFYNQYANGVHFCVKPECISRKLDMPPDVNCFQDGAKVEFVKMQTDEDKNDDVQDGYGDEDVVMQSRKPLVMRLQPLAKRSNWAPYIVVCGNCEETLGNICPIGPKNDSLCCLTASALYVVNSAGRQIDTKGKWATLRPFLGPAVELRDILTFYGLDAMHISKFTSKPLALLRPTSELVKQMPLKELTLDKPRSYQIECYIQAALGSSIVYLPTGAGKTLVASMMAGLMHKLNPFKVVLFVVHRVSLAFQQAQYIKDQTGLDVFVACGIDTNEIFAMSYFIVGETVDDMPKNANLIDVPVIVVTAQVLINWIKMQQLRLEDCSLLMMDEVHNAVKAHPYVLVMKEFYGKVEPAYKPLFLGLTASPTSGQLVAMHLTLQELCHTCSARIYLPCIFWDDLMQTINRPKITFSVVDISDEMALMVRLVVRYCKYLIDRVKILLGIKSILLFPEEENMNAARGFIRALSDRAHQENSTDAMQLTLLMSQVFSATEIVSVLGPRHGRLYLSEVLNAAVHKRDTFFTEKDKDTTEQLLDAIRPLDSVSSKVTVLLEIMTEAGQEDPQATSRIIIFVQTKRTARQLFNLLRDNEAINERWLPAMFVGQSAGQVDGMSYVEEQAPTLMRFRLGQHRLLISTNVLQEGMDVPVCNRVILFDQSWSLTSFIQSRGRARAMDSVYNLICSKREKELYEALIKTETMMESTILRVMALSQTVSLPMSMLVLFKKQEADAQVHWQSRRETLLTISADKEASGPAHTSSARKIKAVSIRFYNLPASVYGVLLENILESVSLINMKFKRLESPCGLAFPNDGVLEMVCEVYATTPVSFGDFYKLFREALKTCDKHLYTLLSYRLLNVPRAPCNDLYLVLAEGMDVGNLLEPNKFVAAHSITKPVKFGISFTEGVIRVFYLAEDQRCFRLDVPFSCVDKFVLVDVGASRPKDASSLVSIVLPLSRAPLLFYAHTQDALDVKLSNMDRLAWERASPHEFADFIRVEEAAALKFDLFLRGMERDELMTVLQRMRGLDGIEEVVFGSVEVLKDHGMLSQAAIIESISYFSEDFDLVYSLHSLFTSCFPATSSRTTPRLFDILNTK